MLGGGAGWSSPRDAAALTATSDLPLPLPLPRAFLPVQVGAVVVGFDRNINYYKIQMATLCIRENPGCMFIATNTGGWPGWRGAGGLGGQRQVCRWRWWRPGGCTLTGTQGCCCCCCPWHARAAGHLPVYLPSPVSCLLLLLLLRCCRRSDPPDRRSGVGGQRQHGGGHQG